MREFEKIARNIGDLNELDKCNQRISMYDEKERLVERIEDALNRAYNLGYKEATN